MVLGGRRNYGRICSNGDSLNLLGVITGGWNYWEAGKSHCALGATKLNQKFLKGLGLSEVYEIESVEYIGCLQKGL